MPQSYAARFAGAMKAKPKIVTIAGAGHLAELDKPDEVAAAIIEWTHQQCPSIPTPKLCTP